MTARIDYAGVAALRRVAIGIVMVSCLGSEPALAWGREGHTIIGLAAQQMLCGEATSEVARLSNGESLERIGQWADEIRRQPEWAHSAPWHYINIPDSGSVRNAPVVPEGDVISAIERFSAVLRADTPRNRERAEALRFLVHFVADIHQPLHVGRAEDRGGNRIDVFFGDVQTNLHSFWDTHTIRLQMLTPIEYAQRISAAAAQAAARDRSSNVRDWAEQAFELRSSVYAFDTQSGVLDADYLQTAAELAQGQLILAAAHLANVLNDAFCR